MGKSSAYLAGKGTWASRVVARVAFFAALWWILTEGSHPVNPLGFAGVAAAAVLSFRLRPTTSWNWRPGPLGRFVVYFLWQSLLGGLDVAHRALNPRSILQPVVIHYPFEVEHEGVRVFFLLVVSLLPGTAAVDLQGDTAVVHLLDRGLSGNDALQGLERRIAALLAPRVSCP